MSKIENAVAMSRGNRPGRFTRLRPGRPLGQPELRLFRAGNQIVWKRPESRQSQKRSNLYRQHAGGSAKNRIQGC